MMKRLLVLIISLALLAAGCGEAGANTTAPEGSSVTTAAEESGTTGAGTSASAEEATAEAEGTTEAGDDPTGAPVVTEDDPYIGPTYSLYIGYDESIWLTEDGRVYNGLGGIDTVCDIVTGEPMYYQLRRSERRQQDTEEESTYSEYALYDLEGNMVLDYAPFTYECVFGGYVLRHSYSEWWEEVPEDCESGLYDIASGSYYMEEIYTIRKMGDLYAAQDEDYKQLGILDENLNILAGFGKDMPWDISWCEAIDGYVKGENESTGESCILDMNLNVCFTADADEFISIGNTDVKGNYFTVRSGAERYFYSLEDFSLIYHSALTQMSYFDGTLAILSNQNETDVYLIDVTTDTVLAGPLASIAPSSGWYDYSPAEFFVGRDSTCHLYKYDRQGNITATANGVENFSLYGGYVTLLPDYYYEDTVFLLDDNLQLIELPKEYTGIQQFYEFYTYDSIPDNIFACEYKNVQGFTRYDLVRDDGTLLAEGFKYLTSDSGRIMGYKGSTVGFLDAEGNWLTRASIYDSYLGEDK